MVLLCLAGKSLGQGNDDFENRIPLSGASVSAVADNRGATSEPGEPSHAASTPNRSVWWTWTASTTGVVNVSGFGSMVDGSNRLRLSAYTGDSLGALSEAGSNNGFSGDGSFDLPVTAGATFHFAIDTGVNSASEAIALSINTSPTVTSSAAAWGTMGRAFSYLIQGSNRPTRYSATGLTPGLFLNES
jgi:hypothetical protein